jgi:hypothetical protein
MALCASDVERWRVAPDPKGPSDSEPRRAPQRSVVTARTAQRSGDRVCAGAAPKKDKKTK